MSAAELEAPLRACEPWCENGDGHGQEHPEDRSCWSTYEVLGLSHPFHRPSHYTDGTWRRAYLNVYLRREPQREEGGIVIHSEETDRELRLTRTEALDLRDMLDSLIDRLEKTETLAELLKRLLHPKGRPGSPPPRPLQSGAKGGVHNTGSR